MGSDRQLKRVIRLAVAIAIGCRTAVTGPIDKTATRQPRRVRGKKLPTPLKRANVGPNAGSKAERPVGLIGRRDMRECAVCPHLIAKTVATHRVNPRRKTPFKRPK